MAVLALHNVAVHRLLPAPADAALNLATAAGLTAFARRAGCSRHDLGIGAGDAGSGLRAGLGIAALAGGAVAWLRLRSRSVLAPILAHAAVNVSAYLVGRRVVGRRR